MNENMNKIQQVDNLPSLPSVALQGRNVTAYHKQLPILSKIPNRLYTINFKHLIQVMKTSTCNLFVDWRPRPWSVRSRSAVNLRPAILIIGAISLPTEEFLRFRADRQAGVSARRHHSLQGHRLGQVSNQLYNDKPQ